MKRRWFFGVLLILMLVCGQAHAYTGEAIIRYQVLPGDTLWYLGQRFQTTAEELKILNQLKTDVIYPGQALFIPVIKTENGFQYKVLKGDSLFLIATRTNRAIQAIKSLNRLSDDLIYPGQILS
ncbi:MAG: LysM peptidoglycan-binding domain-containing protein, partial [Clostridia bacterium]|nr:LysM peptidoglycan-binding domain-containing protein [Clostridia bacterium]